MEPKPSFENIALEKVVLAQFTGKMVQRYYEWLQDPDIQRDTCTEGLSLEEVAGLMEVWARPGVYTFIVCDKEKVRVGSEEEAMIGDLNLFVNEESVEVNLMVAEKEYRKLGIGREVVGFVEKFVREVLGLRRVVAKIGENNVASIGLFKKMGFVEFERNTDFGELHFIKDLI